MVTLIPANINDNNEPLRTIYILAVHSLTGVYSTGVTAGYWSEVTELSSDFNLQIIYLLEYQNFVFLKDSNGIRTHNHLVCKQTLNNLANQPSSKQDLFDAFRKYTQANGINYSRNKG